MLSRIYYRYTYSINESTSLHKSSIDYTESKCAIRAWLAACMHTFSAHWTIKIWAILGSRSTANPHVVLYVGRHSDIKKLASCNHACATYIECALFKCRDKEETQDSSLLHWVESGTWSIVYASLNSTFCWGFFSRPICSLYAHVSIIPLNQKVLIFVRDSSICEHRLTRALLLVELS